MPALIDLTGQKFGRLTVIERCERPKGRKSKEAFWLCKCDCGNESTLSGYELRSGNTKSCGCYHKERTSQLHLKHGYYGTRLYRIYYKMKERCYKPSNDNYKYYGGLGITICDEWLNDFSAFAKWSIENGYDEKLTIDRKDNTKGYSPDNCRWITIQEQQRNRRKRGTVLCR
nr:MAG TPA: PROTEIN/DNA Complex catalytic motif, Helix-turn-helix DNA [Caudoviricetes sp.]